MWRTVDTVDSDEWWCGSEQDLALTRQTMTEGGHFALTSRRFEPGGQERPCRNTIDWTKEPLKSANELRKRSPQEESVKEILCHVEATRIVGDKVPDAVETDFVFGTIFATNVSIFFPTKHQQKRIHNKHTNEWSTSVVDGAEQSSSTMMISKSLIQTIRNQYLINTSNNKCSTASKQWQQWPQLRNIPFIIIYKVISFLSSVFISLFHFLLVLFVFIFDLLHLVGTWLFLLCIAHLAVTSH